MRDQPDNLLFLHLLRDGIQNELFHHLSRDGGEAGGPVVSWVLLLVIFKDWRNTDFPPVLRYFSCPPGPFKDDGEWLSNDICQLPQHSWVHLIRVHGFVSVQFT